MLRACIAVALVVLVVGCAHRTRYASPPSEREKELRDAGPHEVDLFPSGAGPACAEALRATDAATEAGDLGQAAASVELAAAACGAGFAVEYRRGWIARAHGDYDAAARAYIRELRGPRPAFVTGAQLLDVLPEANGVIRRQAAQLGGRRWGSNGGFEGVGMERVAEIRCGGRPARMAMVSCRPGMCTYKYLCKGGGRRTIQHANDMLERVGEPLP